MTRWPGSARVLGIQLTNRDSTWLLGMHLFLNAPVIPSEIVDVKLACKI